MLRFVTSASALCSAASVCSNTSSAGLAGSRYEVIPLKPRTTPVKEFVVTPVYVMISSSTFSRPHSLGKLLVEFTWISVSSAEISWVRKNSPATTSGVRLESSRYWSKLG